MIAEGTALAEALEREYGLVAPRLTRLGGENVNFLVETATGARYVLKRWSTEAVEGWPDLDAALADRIANQNIGVDVPRLVRTRAGSASAGGGVLFTFVDGTAWRHANRTPQLREHLGRTLAEIDLALSGVRHPAAHRSHIWDLTNASQH